MKKDKDNLRNGLELILSCQLTVELLESYKIKGISKRYLNMFIKSIEKDILKGYDKIYEDCPEFVTNAINIKHRLIKDISKLTEDDAILFSEFSNKFNDNIEVARKKGLILFDKIL